MMELLQDFHFIEDQLSTSFEFGKLFLLYNFYGIDFVIFKSILRSELTHFLGEILCARLDNLEDISVSSHS